ncbi:Petrobactin-binding protein YclQ [Vibrio stylophorae]|uniref:Petrobactin-binding protein YclQ n=1 Tax=Vibrio stylophorae TaxID=659351 RepID=A0ABN8DTN0_9VIBR|nr:ABC transporter substrate-binding protein [Vibrio stylophorae]CAH0533265.1 Petrobactin-binding protein YclQ [Vibrio stylophorae]
MTKQQNWWVTLGLLLVLGWTPWAKGATYTHALGETHLDKTPQRIVVLGFASLDLLQRLAIKPVGVTQTLLPEYLASFADASYVHAGSLSEPDFETIFELAPDLIIIEGRMAGAYQDLSQIAPTYIFMPDAQNYWSSVQQGWRDIGAMLNKSTEVERLIDSVQQQMSTLQAKVKAQPLSTLMVMNNGNKIAMFGPNSRFGLIYRELGFPSVSHDTSANGPHGHLISFEYIAQQAPQILFVMDREQAIGRAQGMAKKQFDNPLMAKTPAAQFHRLIFLNPSVWYLATGGVTATELMLADLNQAFIAPQVALTQSKQAMHSQSR